MSSSQSIFESTRNNSTAAYGEYLTHSSQKRVDTKSQILGQLSARYTEHHVTEVKESVVSLFEFAAAGKAELTFDEGQEFAATRGWKPVGDGLKKKMHPGVLNDEYRFARFHYSWDNKDFLVYYVQYQDAFSTPTKLFYILSPRATSTIESAHCVETDALILAAGKWSSQLHNEIFVFDDGHWQKSKELWNSVAKSSWDDVILDPDMKKSIIDDVQSFFDNQPMYASFAVPWKRGIILHGVPGNGKTVSIKALMNSLYGRPDAIPSLYVKSVETNCQTAQYSISRIFQGARNMAPCLLIFEDLDSLVGDDTRSYFLNEVDGLESNEGILMVGSTNHLDRLDPAIAKRPSRFDRKYHFKIPSEDERRSYVEYWRNKLLKLETVEFPEELTDIIAKLTEGFSFAYLKELFVVVLMSLVRGYKGAEDFEVVHKEEAASANETPAETPSVCEAEAVCTCKLLCETCKKPLPQSPTACTVRDAGEDIDVTDENTERKKMVIPDVDVPETLADNVLLKVLKYQIRMLLSEMDNTNDEDKNAKKTGNLLNAKNRGRGGRLTLRNAGGCC